LDTTLSERAASVLRIACAIESRAQSYSAQNKQEQVKVSSFQSSQFDRIFLQPLKATTGLAKIVL
jgi:hypothetical protein